MKFALTRQERLLLRCVRATPDITQLRQEISRSAFDWQALWELAAVQDIQPLVACRLADDRLASLLTREARAEMQELRFATIVQNLAARAELSVIAGELQQWQIPVIPLKGVHLAERAFERLDARRCGDIDILVREEDWARAHSVLGGLGYRPISLPSDGLQHHPFHGVPLERTDNGRRFIVELHHHLTDPRFVNINYDDLWLQALNGATVTDGAVPLPVEELLLFLALHLPKHDSGMLRLVADIDHLVTAHSPMIDWARVVEVAESWHVGTLLYFALDASTQLFDTAVPKTVLLGLRPALWKRLAVPVLGGPRIMLRPPASDQRRSRQFRLTYNLMMASYSTMLRACWHFSLVPVVLQSVCRLRSKARWVDAGLAAVPLFRSLPPTRPVQEQR